MEKASPTRKILSWLLLLPALLCTSEIKGKNFFQAAFFLPNLIGGIVLGYVTDSVRQLVRDRGFPGMKVLEFAFDSRDTGSASDYLPIITR